MFKFLDDEAHRAWVYRILFLLFVAVVACVMLVQGKTDNIVGLIAALLGLGGTGLAAANTSTKREDPPT